jgi:hypothetical protein
MRRLNIWLWQPRQARFSGSVRISLGAFHSRGNLGKSGHLRQVESWLTKREAWGSAGLTFLSCEPAVVFGPDWIEHAMR